MFDLRPMVGSILIETSSLYDLRSYCFEYLITGSFMHAHQHHTYSLDNQILLSIFRLLFAIFRLICNDKHFKFKFRNFPCHLFRATMQSLDIVILCLWIRHCLEWMDTARNSQYVLCRHWRFEDIFEWLRCALRAHFDTKSNTNSQNFDDDQKTELPIISTHANQINGLCVNVNSFRSWAELNWTELQPIWLNVFIITKLYELTKEKKRKGKKIMLSQSKDRCGLVRM